MIGWWMGLVFLPGKLGQSLLWGTSQSPHYNMNSAVNVTVDHRTAVVRSLARQNKPAGRPITADTYHP